MKATTQALAKVNLTLEVLGKRADGFHEILSVMQTVSLADRVVVAENGARRRSSPATARGPAHLSPPPAGTPEDDVAPVRVVCEGAEILPAENLVRRAALLLAAARPPLRHITIALQKRIPVAAGLGGGSSDGAATLRALDLLWDHRLGAAGLSDIAARLGSDVPFFLLGGAALVAGRGETLRALPPFPRTWLVVATPPLRLADKTRVAYSLLRPEHYAAGTASHLLAGRDRSQSLEDAPLFNSFEAVADTLFPDLTSWRARLEQLLGRKTHLSGAGPSVFAVFPAQEAANLAAARAAPLEGTLSVVHFVDRLPAVRLSGDRRAGT